MLIITQSAHQVKISSTSQLIRSISRVLQKLIKYFNGTIILIPFISPSLLVWHVIFVLNLNESVALVLIKSIILPALFTAGISLQQCYKLPDIYEWLTLYYIKLCISINISIYSALSIWALSIWIPLFAAVPSAAVLLTDIFPLTSIYAPL